MIFSTVIAQYLEKTFLKGHNWAFKALLVIIFFTFFVNVGFDLKRWAYFKNFFSLATGGPFNPLIYPYYWLDIAYQTTDMLMQRIQVWDHMHIANMRFRILLPALWMVFHSAAALYIIQLVLGVCQLYMTMQLVYSITQDRLQAFYFTLGFAGLYTGAAFYLDFYGFGDAYAFTLMTAALYFRKPFLIFIAVFLAALVDERALLNTSFIMLFHWLTNPKQDFNKLTLKSIYLNKAIVAALLAGCIYMIIRLYLTVHFHLKTPYGGPSPLFHVRDALKQFGFRVWTGFESFWILILMMLFLLSYRRIYVLLALVMLLLSITVFTFLLQGDHTRTAAYAFPLFFVAMVLIRDEVSQPELRAILMLVSIISTVLSPILY